VLQSVVLRSWLKALVAVLLGNLTYFLILMPYLPAAGRHRPNRLDWGLAVDFWVCVAVYGLVDLISRKVLGRQPS
jgi:energy-converting hydrogenase Eha subunit A